MNSFHFNEESEIEIFSNGDNGITIRQRNIQADDGWDYVTIYSKHRAMAVAAALRSVANACSFENPENEEGE